MRARTGTANTGRDGRTTAKEETVPKKERLIPKSQSVREHQEQPGRDRQSGRYASSQ